MAGQSFNLTIDSNILTLNSPKASVGGPYKVVYKNIDERWVIVAMDWELEPRLAIRWFWGNGGNPFSSGNPTWLVIPSSLSNSILNGLPLDFKFHSRLVDFLAGRITGSQI
ncbi:hypothetical protein [Chryseobacterium sp. Leaf394]|uniref:hypothetical protein n=1 Tax=Chryseobacterium sp. Leaf394 TaxID=1736361 RepID=UPI00070142A9|nr:hypothetical protein [Chryseobacterium sp. Leaf394]KQS93013.1 hypothetical protein ASG21_11450 [Chryseobacterium sp. Leaf394]